MHLDSVQVNNDFMTRDEINTWLEAIDRSGWVYNGATSEHSIRIWRSELYHEKVLIEKLLAKFPEEWDFEVLQCFANGQTFGQNGEFHTDAEGDEYYTLLVYLSDINDGNYSFIRAHTELAHDGEWGEKVEQIEPYRGRSLLFKSNILHRGCAPTWHTDMLRISLALKLRLKTFPHPIVNAEYQGNPGCQEEVEECT